LVGFRDSVSAVVVAKGWIGCLSIEMFFSKGGNTPSVRCLSLTGLLWLNRPFNFSCSSSKSTWFLGASTASVVTPETIRDLERWKGFVVDFSEDWELKADGFRPRWEITEGVDGRVCSSVSASSKVNWAGLIRSALAPSLGW
jgi:hypothetical protein